MVGIAPWIRLRTVIGARSAASAITRTLAPASWAAAAARASMFHARRASASKTWASWPSSPSSTRAASDSSPRARLMRGMVANRSTRHPDPTALIAFALAPGFTGPRLLSVRTPHPELPPARGRRAANRKQRDDENDHGPPCDCECAVVPGQDVPHAESLLRALDGLGPARAVAEQRRQARSMGRAGNRAARKRATFCARSVTDPRPPVTTDATDPLAPARSSDRPRGSRSPRVRLLGWASVPE